MLSSLFFLAFCFVFTFMKKTDEQANTITFFILFLILLFISILTFVSNPIKKSESINSVYLTTFKMIWILSSCFLYSYSRGAVAEIFDISYESTFSKPTTIGITIIFTTMVYFIFIVLSPVLLDSVVISDFVR
ncbi:hypothetical protein Xinn_03818 [Xenorhabdus innexi]|uniref:Uncharacterized protein n=1 Tax=Xenorhabdus innexi TaxID=290109 RepID=A0A2G0N1G8_9GAMM|nr:hypothetical protein Xinn_03818 [Xenorhabdus innexi]